MEKFKIDFATIYFYQPDRAGHDFGPDSNEYKNKVRRQFNKMTKFNLI